MAASLPSQLRTDTDREAVDSMRGYSYQILRSVEAWIDLAHGEMLVLEGAEDLDKLGDDGTATAEQIKDTSGSGNITLRSKNLLEAIGNFWKHLERNPGVKIQLRFLTTSNIGQEKSRPFGFDERGIEAWRRIRTAPTSVESHTKAMGIQAFLKEQVALPIGMRDWLAISPVQAFIDRIIVPIEWVTGWPEWQHLYDTVLAKLIELADPRGIGPADAAKALDALYTNAWRVVITKGNRTLRRGDLIRILDQSGTTAVPNKQLLLILGALTGAPSNGPLVTVPPQSFGLAPRVSIHRHIRSVIEEKIRVAKSIGTVLVYGGTGMGKTSLAVAVTGSERPIAWVDMRGLLPGAAAARIDELVARLSQIGLPYDVVLDDLPIEGDARAIEAPLGRLRETQDNLGGTLLLTCVDRLPWRMASEVILDRTRSFLAPAFEEQDIRDYLLERGCPTKFTETWSKIIFISTRGHPQLVDARLAALVESGFPAPNISELVETRPEILDVRAEARSLIRALPETDRELLARSSLLSGRVPRARVMMVAALYPPIAEPGNVIDRLTGPWLERTDNNDLRTSPLLTNLGATTRGRDWAVEMHRGIAFTFAKSKSLFASDVFVITTHAMAGQTAKPLIPIIMSLLQADPKVWAQVVETAFLLTSFGIGDSLPLPFPDPSDIAAFRVLQLRIAIEAGKQDQVTQIVDQALEEFDRIETSIDRGPELFKLLFLWELLQRPGDMSLIDRLSHALRFTSLLEKASKLLRAIQEQGVLKDGGFQWSKLAACVPMALISGLVDAASLNELLDGIEQLNPNDRVKTFTSLAMNLEGTKLLFTKVWLGEAQKSQKRWPDLAAALKRVIDLSYETGVVKLIDTVAPLLVRVLDENVADPEAALAVANSTISEDIRPLEILAAKARVLWRRQRLPEALELYEETISGSAPDLTWTIDVLRDAGIAAGRAEQWPLAARRLTDAVQRMSDEEPLWRHIGFLFDLAIALHLSGRTRDAVNRLGEAIELLVGNGQASPPEPLISIQQLGSQAIKSIGAELGKAAWGNNEMPLRQIFSAASTPLELAWGKQKPAALDVITLVMAELDLLMPERPAIAERMARYLRNSQKLMVQCAQGDMLTQLAVCTLDMSDAVLDSIREVRALSIVDKEYAAGLDPTDSIFDETSVGSLLKWQERIKYRLLARIVAMIAQGRALVIPVDAWLSAVPTDGNMTDVIIMLEELKRLISGTEDASGRLMEGNAAWDSHLLAALMAPVQKHLSAAELIVSHVVSACYLYKPKLRNFVTEPFSEIVTAAWLDRCEWPTQLVTPRVTVPEIRKAVTNSIVGWQRVLKVLEAAQSAVSPSVGPAVRKHLEALRDQISSNC